MICVIKISSYTSLGISSEILQSSPIEEYGIETIETD